MKRIAIIALMTVGVYACQEAPEFIKDCDLCRQVNGHEVKLTLNDYVYNDNSDNISKEGLTQINEIKSTLRSGAKVIECGCADGVLVYHLWCSNDDTYQLEVNVLGDRKFEITGIQPAEFSHP